MIRSSTGDIFSEPVHAFDLTSYQKQVLASGRERERERGMYILRRYPIISNDMESGASSWVFGCEKPCGINHSSINHNPNEVIECARPIQRDSKTARKWTNVKKGFKQEELLYRY
jgi:hypothetical protein